MTHTIKYPRDSKTEAFDLQIKKILEKLGKMFVFLRVSQKFLQCGKIVVEQCVTYCVMWSIGNHLQVDRLV